MERPILFDAAMVRAILDGRKTQTRRPVLPQPNDRIEWATAFVDAGEAEGWMADGRRFVCCPFGVAGDHLWVRETWAPRLDVDPVTAPKRAKQYCRYAADTPGSDPTDGGTEWHSYSERWRPSIHMPRWASRITLEVLAVWAERIQDITEESAIAEGVIARGPSGPHLRPHQRDFRIAWDSIYGKTAPWDSNPGVFACSFRRVPGEV